MFNYKTKKLPKNTIEIIVTVPKTEIAAEYESALERIQKELIVEGFRKGKVPKDVARRHVKQEVIYQELIKTLLPKIYEKVVEKESFKPFFSPKIELLRAKEGEDWQIKFTIAERPTVELGDYKGKVKEVKAKYKKADIWVPGKGEKTPEQKQKEEAESQQKQLNEILAVLLKETKIEISDIVIDEEINRRLSQLLDDIQKIGLTVDAYLKSKGMTMEDLKAKYKQEIEDTYKLEFLLNGIADQEGISVDKAELDKLFANITDVRERKMAEENAYFYASILRKQKTLDYLLAL